MRNRNGESQGAGTKDGSTYAEGPLPTLWLGREKGLTEDGDEDGGLLIGSGKK
jgi:hypothetical protein